MRGFGPWPAAKALLARWAVPPPWRPCVRGCCALHKNSGRISSGHVRRAGAACRVGFIAVENPARDCRVPGLMTLLLFLKIALGPKVGCMLADSPPASTSVRNRPIGRRWRRRCREMSGPMPSCAVRLADHFIRWREHAPLPPSRARAFRAVASRRAPYTVCAPRSSRLPLPTTAPGGRRRRVRAPMKFRSD